MPSSLRCLILLVLSGLATGAWSNPITSTPACPSLAVTDAGQRSQLLHHVCYLTAAPGEPGWQANDPTQLDENLTWTPAGGHDLVFAHSNTTYWFGLNVHNPTRHAGLWYLKVDYAPLDRVTFWLTDRDGTRILETGDQTPFRTRGIDYRYFLLPVMLEAGEHASIALRVRSNGALNVPLKLTTPDLLIAESNHLTLTHGLFYGALLIFAIFNLLLFFSSRTAYYFYNAFYMVTTGTFLFAMGGFANQYLWPDSPWFANASIPFFMGLSSFSMVLFGRSFLELESSGGLLPKVLWIQGLGAALLTILAFIIPYSQSITINTVFSLLVITNLFVMGLLRWRQGYAHAKWYVLAWSLMVAGTLIYALAAFGYLADFLAREALMQGAIGGQVILLNYAIVQRWRALHQKLLDVEHNAKHQLELKVHERTAQLREAMSDLEKANRKLAELSLNDQLTGLHNRRYLDQMVADLSAASRRTRQPMAMVLLDADHFKRLNDTWGHAFGDTCLQRIADILTAHVRRPRDVVARFGGEEFALVLPETDGPGAFSVVGHILTDVESSPVTTPEGDEVTITLSAGIAIIATGESSLDLFRRADEALYLAKARGRNRIELSPEPVDGPRADNQVSRLPE